jgi:hypothetical protein
VRIEVSLGEAVDRLSILTLKCDRIPHGERRTRAEQAREAVLRDWGAMGLPQPDSLPEWTPLHQVNASLWDVEDAVRDHEQRNAFGQDFVKLARSVYALNDRRAAAKAAIDERLGSRLREVKSYGHEQS